MSNKSSKRKWKWFDILLYISAFFAYYTISSVTQDNIKGESNPVNYSITIAISLVLLFIYWKKTRIKIPSEIRETISRAERGWLEAPQFDIPPIFVILISAIPELTFHIFNILYGYIFVIIYISLSYFLYLRFRNRIRSSGMMLSLMSVISSLSPIPGILFLKNPELLSNYLPIDVYTSRSISFLLFMSTQFFLVYNTLVISSYAWRNRILINNNLDQKSFHDLQKKP